MSNSAKILLVEEEPFLCGMYQTRLKIEGHEVQAVDNGVEAWDRLSKQSYDLILLDLIAEKEDRFEFLQKVRSAPDKTLANTPVVIITNLGRKNDIEQGMRLGASDYIVKANFTPTEVVEKIKHHLKEHHGLQSQRTRVK